MTRVLAYLTLIPTLFTFIAIVLINVGGVNPSLGAGFSSMREENSAFGLLKVFLIYNFLFWSKWRLTASQWDYTISQPQRSSSDYSYHLFLNRLCGGYNSMASGRSQIVRRCQNRRIGHLRDGSNLYSLGSIGSFASPFRFTTVNLDIPLAFYMLSAILVSALMIMAFVGARGSNKRGGQRVAAFCSGVSRSW